MGLNPKTGALGLADKLMQMLPRARQIPEAFWSI